jgi:uncharacterized protein YraI
MKLLTIRRFCRSASILAALVCICALAAPLAVQAAPGSGGGAMASWQIPPAATVTARQGNVWAGPGRGFWFIGTLRRNETVPLLGISEDEQFWYVETRFGKGWLWYQDVSVNDPGVEIIDPGPFGTITAGRVVVRGGPGLGAQQLGQMSKGQQFLVLEIRTDGGWLFIQYRGGKGWIAASNTTLADGLALDSSAPATKEAVAIVNTGSLNIRTGPDFRFASIGTVSGGTSMRIIGRNRAGDWLQVDSPFGEGWVNVIYVTTRNYFGSAPVVDVAAGDAERAPAVFRALTGRLNVRSGPNVSFPSQFTIDAGQNFPILGQSKDRQWWLIETPNGEGWVLKQLGQSSGDVANVPVIE